MKIFKIVYSVKENENILQIFESKFIRKNKNKCSIIYNNKIYPLQEKFKPENRTIKKLKIQLVCYTNIPDIKKIIEENNSIIKYDERRVYKNNLYNDIKYNLRYSYYKWQKMVYKINPKFKTIRIFGSYFVDKNKDKGIIIFNNKIFPIQEFFSLKDIKNEENKIEIFLIELDNISDKSYMFQYCDSLLELSLSNRDQKYFKIMKMKMMMNIIIFIKNIGQKQ